MSVPGPDLVAVVLSLRPREWARIPRSHGVLAHGAAFDLFRRLSPRLAGELHRSDLRRRPFTASPLFSRTAETRGWIDLHPDAKYTWRLTGLTAEVSAHLLQLTADIGEIFFRPVEADLQTQVGGGLLGCEPVLGARFQLVSVATQSEQHRDAGQGTYQALWSRWERRCARAVTLRFLTPTTFRAGGFERPNPSSRLVFGSLLSVWNAFSGRPLRAVSKVLANRVELSNWDGETRRVELIARSGRRNTPAQGAHGTVGFVGKFTYRVFNVDTRDPDSSLRRVLGLLAEFAFFAGVGWMTTHGLGQVRPTISLDGSIPTDG